ncbi:hypothetical protein K435DRAFT_799886 [Dendrothele bispora CBS 962.96]|uniref:Uncharacterized protein n=1 Tax=Dendrothele bispora (strain CBS 962.96) TaxID=1314807 RepID=A0A4S8LUI5_DENBC|nr:hypothetical protein K435DRAFT_799886 [Dendrothele bispora CBS 962.96]
MTAPPSMTNSIASLGLQTSVSSMLVALRSLEKLYPASSTRFPYDSLLPVYHTSRRGFRFSHEDELLDLLDTLATCLSKTPQDLYATSLRRDQKPVILLAKGGVVTVEDRYRVAKFFEVLKCHRDQESREVNLLLRVLPFLAGNIGPLLNAKIVALRVAMECVDWSHLAHFFEHRYHLALRDSKDSKHIVQDVFPVAGYDYAKLVPENSDIDLSLHRFIMLLVKHIVKWTNQENLYFDEEGTAPFVSVNMRKRNDTLVASGFRILTHYCEVLSNSRFMGFLLHAEAVSRLERQKAILLARRLEELLLFTDGIMRLMEKLNLVFPDGGVEYEWVGDYERDKGTINEFQVKLLPISDVMRNTFPELHLFEPLRRDRTVIEGIHRQLVLTKSLQISSLSWPETVEAQVDPSVKILLHLESEGHTFIAGPQFRVPIGRSSPAPWCTAEWMRIYQSKHRGVACAISGISMITPVWWRLPFFISRKGDVQSQTTSSIVESVNRDFFTTIRNRLKGEMIR